MESGGVNLFEGDGIEETGNIQFEKIALSNVWERVGRKGAALCVCFGICRYWQLFQNLPLYFSLKAAQITAWDRKLPGSSIVFWE